MKEIPTTTTTTSVTTTTSTMSTIATSRWNVNKERKVDILAKRLIQ